MIGSTERGRRRAVERVALVEAALRIRADGRGDAARRIADLARRGGAGRSAVYGWLKAVAYGAAPRHEWPELLSDGRSAAGRPQPKAEIPAAVWAEFKREYLRLEAPTLAWCYRCAQRLARHLGVGIPSQPTFRRRIREEVPYRVRVLSREGEVAARAALGSQRRDVSELRPMEAVSGDGYRHNCFVVAEDGEGYRPCTWFWQDVRTRRILAWRTDRTENKDILRLAFLDLCRRHGLPKHLVIDNTRAAANKWMSGGLSSRKRFGGVRDEELPGVFAQLGIEVHWTSIVRGENGKAAGHGQAKPVERAFRDFDEFDRGFAGAYAGRSPRDKPANYGSAQVPEAEFRRALAEYVGEFNGRPGRRSHAVAGGSYDAEWERLHDPARVMRLHGEQEMLLLLAAEARTIRKDGTFTLDAGKVVRSARNVYGSDWLAERAGERLAVRFDPDDLHADVYVFDRAGRHLGRASCILPVGFLDTTASREVARLRSRQVKALRAAHAAHVGEQAVEGRQRARRVKAKAAPAKAPASAPVPPVPRRGGRMVQDLIDFYSEEARNGSVN